MKQTLHTSEAVDQLLADEYAAWTRAGALALVEYLEGMEAEGEEMDFDRVAIRCDFSEYGSAIEAAQEYDYESDEDDDDLEGHALEWLQDKTDVITFDGGVIIRQF